MTDLLWQRCLDYLRYDGKISEDDLVTWIRPLEARISNNEFLLLAPNAFVFKQVEKNFLPYIVKIIKQLVPDQQSFPQVRLTMEDYGNLHAASNSSEPTSPALAPNSMAHFSWHSNLNVALIFKNYVTGKSNQLACAAAQQVAENPERVYNPLVIYGGVGLGKTHLMQAVGNAMIKNNPKARVLYLHSERFVANMVEALRHNKMEQFKKLHRSVYAILVDDVQFFSGKERSQEEFFHTFNALLDGQRQVILTSDRYPKELAGLAERLKSRFGWGLTVGVEPPELETRVAILINKAVQSRVILPDEVAFFIAQRINSNVRELEGALKRVIANAHFTGQPITLTFVKETLKDLLALQAKLVSIENIQKVIADYYKISLFDLLAKNRARSVLLPRQIAMTLAKELTEKSLPEIGRAFAGRDHTTVLHAARKIKKLLEQDSKFKETYERLRTLLSA